MSQNIMDPSFAVNPQFGVPKLPKQPDRYPSMDFPVQLAPSEYPKAIYSDAPHIGHHAHPEGLDHVRHKQPVIVLNKDGEDQVRGQDHEWHEQENARRAKLQEAQEAQERAGEESAERQQRRGKG